MADKQFNARIRWKRDTSANWTSNNPVLLNGEIIIVDTDSGEMRFKIGDGVKTYTQLPFEDEVVRNLININTSAITKLNGDDTTEGSVAKAIADAKSIIDANIDAVEVKADAAQTSVDNLTNTVAYINKEDNENIENIAASSVIIDSALSRTSTNPVQNATITAELDTIKDAKADWNQNDEAAISYVKNRPFYKHNDVLIGTTTFTATSDKVMTRTTDNNDMTIFRVFNELQGNGRVLKMVINNKSCLFGVSFSRGWFDTRIPEGSDIHFYVYYSEGREWTITIGINSVSLTSGEIYSVEFHDITERVKTIPEEYFPDTIFYQGNAPVNFGTGAYSTVQGQKTTASGNTSHAEGWNTTASGNSSHAEGSSTTASGYFSHAEGVKTTASGENSHAEGDHTESSGKDQHVQGRYNITDTTSADIVGNGTSDTNRSNAYTLDWDGNAWFAGNVYVGSRSGTNKDDRSVRLATVNELSGCYKVHVFPDENNTGTYISSLSPLDIASDFLDALANGPDILACVLMSETEVSLLPFTKFLQTPSGDNVVTLIVEFSANVSGENVSVRLQSTLTNGDNGPEESDVSVTVTRNKAIPAPAIATVGQILKVKTVDADGKITETEAVTMPEDVIIQSSTEGSTKKFKITVDDNGILSAAEVNI